MEKVRCCLLFTPVVPCRGCNKEAEWVIWDGVEPAYDHITYACTSHVGYLLSDSPEMHKVYPMEWEV